MKEVRVYSDGSGNSFGDDGGWGYRIVIDGCVVDEGNGYLPNATNNVAEITAAIRGLQAAQLYVDTNFTESVQIVLVSDSQLTLGYANGKYKCKAEHLRNLHKEIRQLYDTLNAKTEWVRGHSGDEHNEAVDKLAGNARSNKGKSCLVGQNEIKNT